MAVFDFNEGNGETGFNGGTGIFLTRVDEGGTVNFTFSLTQIDGASGPPASGRLYYTADGSIGANSKALFFDQHNIADDIIRMTATSAGGTTNQFHANTANPIVIVAKSAVGPWTISFTNSGTGTGTVTRVINPTTLTVSVNTGSYTGITFTSSQANATLNIETITSQFNCFCAGTGIETPNGPVPVENLRPGDRISTAGGSDTRVKWLGEQPIDTRLSHPARVNPIRITAGALGDGLPERDLHLSADHALCIDGLLINAGALVNGETIYQVKDMPLDGFTYYHIETEGGHELLLAEGVAAESFIDYASADSFTNAAERTATTPIPEMNLPRISAARLVPQAVRDRLAERAEALRAGRGMSIAAE